MSGPSTDRQNLAEACGPFVKQDMWPTSLLVSDDPDLIDHVLALTSASQLTTEVLAAAEDAAHAWLRSVVVVIGVDRLHQIAQAGLPSRPQVVVSGALQTADWRVAFELGADDVVEPPGEPG